MKTSIIILNYNDFNTTFSLIQSIEDYEVFDKIIVVDGKSTDDSFERLKRLQSSHIHVIEANENGGYGYGNNIGLLYAKKLGCDYVAVANPDVSFEEKVVKDCLMIIANRSDCVAIAPRVSSGRTAFRLAPPIKDICYSSLLLNKIVKPRYYSECFFKDKEYCYVDALPGSFVIFNLEMFYECGLYDEHIFLFHEEVTIATKFKKAGYKSILYLEAQYNHMHSATITKVHKRSIKPALIGFQSHKYYLKNYCESSRIILLLFDLICAFAVVEKMIWAWITSLLINKK